MTTIKHSCENCGSQFSITYDAEVCDADPTFCPMCAEMMFLDDDLDLEDESF